MAESETMTVPGAPQAAGIPAQIPPVPALPVPDHPAPALAAFRSEEPDTRLRDLLAFALAAEDGKPLPPEGVAALRRRAETELVTHAFRLLHNRVEEIRREAVAEQAGRARPPVDFGRLLLANLAAIAIAAVIAAVTGFPWHPIGGP